ncbi:MAG: hypothetical protein K8H88_02320, partial [Sandaracinaceae bacterium]|nr:hypothetical protein [Sandaracinaceae bacterium]
ADSAIQRAAVRCELELPPPTGGMTIDLATVAVRYYAGSGGEEVLRQVASSAECNDAGFLLEGGTRVVLCPAACTRIEADPNARLTVLSGCNPELY